MADNYLERKMEDLRNGSFNNSSLSRPSTTPRKGYVSFPMPPRRVLMIGGLCEPFMSTARALLKCGCKVAIADSDIEKGAEMAKNEGIRFIPLLSTDNYLLKTVFDNIIKAWRDIDILITPVDLSNPLASFWLEHKERFPIPSDYGGRVIIIHQISSASDKIEIPANKELNTKLSAWRIALNTIKFRETSDTSEGNTYSTIANTVLFLSLPESSHINGSTIFIC